jgi:hypothetical protein
VSGVGCQEMGVRKWVSGVGCQEMGVGCRVSGNGRENCDQANDTNGIDQ